MIGDLGSAGDHSQASGFTEGRRRISTAAKKFSGAVEISLPHSVNCVHHDAAEKPMQYMFLIYLDETKFAVMNQSERDGFVNAMLDYDDSLRASGHLLGSEALKAPSEAVTLRKWDGALSMTDGPFMETKEHLSGFILVRARDLNEAIQLAERMPLAKVGSIEVRPIDALERIAT